MGIMEDLKKSINPSEIIKSGTEIIKAGIPINIVNLPKGQGQNSIDPTSMAKLSGINMSGIANKMTKSVKSASE